MEREFYNRLPVSCESTYLPGLLTTVCVLPKGRATLSKNTRIYCNNEKKGREREGEKKGRGDLNRPLFSFILNLRVYRSTRVINTGLTRIPFKRHSLYPSCTFSYL